MNVSASKETVLKKIREALTQSTPIPFPGSEGNSPVYQPRKQELELEFGEQFTRLMGRFVYCLDAEELKAQLATLLEHNRWKRVVLGEEQFGFALPPACEPYHDLATCDASITGCEALVARTGTIVMSSAQTAGRSTSVYAPIHLCIAYTDQLVYDVRDALQLMRERYAASFPSLVTFATGPSRTADIEKTLVVGVHGPKEVYLFLVER